MEQRFILLGLDLLVIVYLIWRLRRLFPFKPERTRFILGFWLWPVILFGFESYFAAWQMSWWLFIGSWALLILTAMVDLFYYFGYSAPSNRWQYASWLLAVPCALFYFRQELFGPKPAELALPNSGQAIVWTDKVNNPKDYYFILTQVAWNPPVDEPNFGRPIFSPIDGTLVDVEDGMMVIQNDQVTLKLGPFLPGSFGLMQGATLFKSQPLGILAEPYGETPGIHIQIIGETPVVFQDTIAGRVFAFKRSKIVPRRNLLIASATAGSVQLK